MAQKDEIAGAATGAVEGAISALPGAAAVAAAPIPGARVAAVSMLAASMIASGVGGFQEESAKAAAKALKDAQKQDKAAQKQARQREKAAMQVKRDDALLAGSMSSVNSQPVTGTQYDRFQAETFGVG